jgi:hypothetical protein
MNDNMNSDPLIAEVGNVIKNGINNLLETFSERYILLENTHNQLMILPSVLNELNGHNNENKKKFPQSNNLNDISNLISNIIDSKLLDHNLKQQVELKKCHEKNEQIFILLTNLTTLISQSINSSPSTTINTKSENLSYENVKIVFEDDMVDDDLIKLNSTNKINDFFKLTQKNENKDYAYNNENYDNDSEEKIEENDEEDVEEENEENVEEENDEEDVEEENDKENVEEENDEEENDEENVEEENDEENVEEENDEENVEEENDEENVEEENDEEDVEEENDEEDVEEENDEEDDEEDDEEENDEENVEEDDEDEDEEDVYSICIKNKSYFTNDNMTGNIYEDIEDEIGDKVGFFKEGKPIFC